MQKALVECSEVMAGEEILKWSMANGPIPGMLKRRLKDPVCAMGFLHWLRVTIQDPDFHNSRQFKDVLQVGANLH